MRSAKEQREAVETVMRLMLSALNSRALCNATVRELACSERQAWRLIRAARKAWSIGVREDPQRVRDMGIAQMIRIREAALSDGDYQRALEAERTRLYLLGQDTAPSARVAARINADGSTTVAAEMPADISGVVPIFVVQPPRELPREVIEATGGRPKERT